MLTSSLFCGGVAFSLVGSLLPLLFSLRLGRSVRRISFLLTVVSSLLFLSFSSATIYANQETYFAAYSLAPSLALSFAVDRLASFFILVISVVSLAVAVYSIQYVEHGRHVRRKNVLASLMNVFILSMVLVVASENTFSFLFFWELMSLSSFFLVMFEYEKPETRKAGIFYFAMTQLSTVFLIIAFSLLYRASGSLSITAVEIATGSAAAVFLALLVGFGIKAGVIPFHKWLPYAHPASPSNISALMSGVMIKVAIYGLMRFVLYVLPPNPWWGIIILVVGTTSAILGVIYALKEHDIKRLLAYHSIENVGIILIGFGLYPIFLHYGLADLAFLSLIGALFHTLNHALFKSLLFLTAGSVVSAVKTQNIEEMGGLIKRMPYTALFFLVGAVSISALPPFNGFVSELMIFQVLLQSYALQNHPMLQLSLMMCLSVFALTSALAAACFVKAFGVMFLAVPRSEEAQKSKEVPFLMLVGPGFLAFLCVFLGVFSAPLLSWLGYPLLIPNLLLVGLLLLLVYAAVYIAVFTLSVRRSRVSETWGCGLLSQNSKMEYTASGFSEPIVTIFKPVYQTKKVSDRTFFDNKQVIFKGGYAEIHLMKFFEEYLYMPVAKMAGGISRSVSALQNGNLDSYINYGFIAVVALLVLLGWYL
ncbi:F(420)H(2) dehydrogenase subunit N [uncultured archaeon]|nr:F(420)H(2) dehydrogenase subunit N [uncultured archaeon]